MGIAQVPYSVLIYGTRMTAERQRIPWESPLSGLLFVRVFRVELRSELWAWLTQREAAYQQRRDQDSVPTEEEFPDIYDFVAHTWFESPRCANKPNYSCSRCVNEFFRKHPEFLQRPHTYLPPAPRWKLVIPIAGDPEPCVLAQ
jgi:hypothetical protein